MSTQEISIVTSEMAMDTLDPMPKLNGTAFRIGIVVAHLDGILIEINFQLPNEICSAITLNSRCLMEELRLALLDPQAYPHPTGQVKAIETHISLIFLAGEFAYKIKKPIQTSFLDYRTLAQRKAMCEKELLINQRFAPELYLDVVPIVCDEQLLRVNVPGEPVEYAVLMHRFAESAVLHDRLRSGQVQVEDMSRLAQSIAMFHQSAERRPSNSSYGSIDGLRAFAETNLEYLRGRYPAPWNAMIEELDRWTHQSLDTLRSQFEHRQVDSIRACHGDLHLSNILDWNGKMMPFDGIEFNEDLRWIDVLSDIAFTYMDLSYHGRSDLASRLMNDYLELTDNYADVAILRWYAVYRALVRAMVAGIRSDQVSNPEDRKTAQADVLKHIELAMRLRSGEVKPKLWITMGVSGSGKSRGSLPWISSLPAIRLRSDALRKSMFPQDETAGDRQSRYAPAASQAVYERLASLSRVLVENHFSVIVDATFLRKVDRLWFREIANQLGAEFGILAFEAPPAELARRIEHRRTYEHDPSEATVEVLEQQLAIAEPLDEIETPSLVRYH